MSDLLRPRDELGEFYKAVFSRPVAYTPQVNLGGNHVGLTTSTAEGWYWVSGGRWFVDLIIFMTAKGSSTGAVSITLPTALNVASFGTDIRYNGVVVLQDCAVGFVFQQLFAVVAPSGTSIFLYYTAAAGGALSQVADTHLIDTTDIRLSINGPVKQ